MAEPAMNGDTAPTAARRSDWLLLPNLITCLRFALLPVFAAMILTGALRWAFVCLIVIGLSDFLDGLLARLCAAMTTLGARLDPLADKLAAVTVTGSFAAVGFVPWAFLLVLLVPDLILLTMTRGRNPPAATWLGKARTALLLIGFPLVLGGQAWQLAEVTTAGLILLVAGAVGHLAAAIHYGSMIVRSRRGSGRS